MTRVEFPEPPPTGVAPTPEATDFAATDPSLAVASLSGIFSAGAGGRLLMDLFVNERSGRLVVAADPGPKGTLFVLHGEPVHAVPVDGDEALLKRLEARRALHPSARVNASTSMNLVSQIARNRWAKPVAVLEALRDEVREFARALFGAVQGLWRFFDDVEFADTTPLTAVNPFGLVLEARRKGLEPDALVRLGDVLGFKTPGPLAGFANVAPRLRSFTGHVDLGGVLDGTMRGAELFKLTGLDPIMGGLVLGALADTGIIELLNTPRATPSTERRQAPTSVLPALVQTDAQQLSQLALLPERGGVDILSLYVELKPERDDNALLGIDVDATPAAIERGFQSRMAELDPRAIAAGASRPYLLARAEELRTKVERSYRARTAGQARAAVDAYDILDRVGEGGMAEVFRGRASDDPNRVVAIKRILPKHRGDAEFARMFLEEARIAKRVQHPNVVRVFTVGKSGEDLYLAMEFVDGCDLGELLRRVHKLKQQVPVDVACKIIADACGGLHAAHRAHDRDGNLAPILHRDVSPQNILVSVAGDVKLTDFGIAKATERTQTGDDKRPSYYASGFPEPLRSEYFKSWHEDHDPKPGQEPLTETLSCRGPSYDEVRPHLARFFQAVRSRQGIVQDALFGHHAALACHMANESYFRKTPVTLDPATKSIKS